MNRPFMLLLVLFFMNISLSSAEEEKYANVFLFDVTGSMEGRGDGMGIDIFDDVKEISKNIIRNYSNDTYLVIIPFGHRVQEDNIFEIHIQSEDDKERAKEFVDDLKATELRTWLTYALEFGINTLGELQNRLPDFDERTQELLLLTDGKGNGPGDLDEDGNFTIDSLISLYRIARTDYPHLYNRFFSVGDILGPDKIERFISEGVSVTEIGRDEFITTKIHTVAVKPQRIFIYDSNPSFELMFEPDDEAAKNLQAKISIVSDIADHAGSGFRISPPSFSINERMLFEVSVINKHALESWMHLNDLKKVEGIISLNADRLFFQPERIRFEYIYETVHVNVSFNDLKIKNSGKVEVKFTNPTDRIINARVDIKQNAQNLYGVEYEVEPHEIHLQGEETISFTLYPADPLMLDSLRKGIDSPIESDVMIALTSITPNVDFDHEDIGVTVQVNRNLWTCCIRPAVIIFAVLLVLILMVFLYFYLLQKEFSQYVITGSGVNRMPLSDYKKFLSNKVIIGKDVFRDTIETEVLTIKGDPFTIISKKPLKLEWHNTDRIEPRNVLDYSELGSLRLSFDKKYSFEINPTDH